MGGNEEVPLTVSVTSRSPAPTRGTTARQTYFPASSWRTDFRVSLFSLLRTCKRERGFVSGGKSIRKIRDVSHNLQGSPEKMKWVSPSRTWCRNPRKKMTKCFGNVNPVDFKPRNGGRSTWRAGNCVWTAREIPAALGKPQLGKPLEQKDWAEAVLRK